MNLRDLTGERLSKADLGQSLFPEFCAQLLRHEYEARHRGSATVDGPGKDKVSDGGEGRRWRNTRCVGR